MQERQAIGDIDQGLLYHGIYRVWILTVLMWEYPVVTIATTVHSLTCCIYYVNISIRRQIMLDRPYCSM